MLYKRSSFITWLKDSQECEIIPLKDARGLKIKNGPAFTFMWTDSNDRIDYEEIWMHCQKLYILEPPGDKVLIKIE